MQQAALLATAKDMQYWQTFFEELGLKLLKPLLPDAELYAVGKESLPDAPAHVQLWLGQLLSLPSARLAILPKPLPIAGDPWSEALPEVLNRRVSALPELLTVPLDGSGSELRTAATGLGQRLTGNPGLVRRALERAQPLEKEHTAHPRWAVAGKRSVGVITPRIAAALPLLTDPLRAELEAQGLHGLWSSELSPSELKGRSARFGELSAGEAEIMGAGSFFGGKGAIEAMVYAVPARDRAALRAAERSREAQHLPTALLELEPAADLGALARL